MFGLGCCTTDRTQFMATLAIVTAAKPECLVSFVSSWCGGGVVNKRILKEVSPDRWLVRVGTPPRLQVIGPWVFGRSRDHLDHAVDRICDHVVMVGRHAGHRH